jgi:uncharacterized membrane protein
MDNNATEQTPETIIVSLGSAEYTVPTGKSVEIAIFITNPSLSGDYFKVNLLGIPQSWVTYPDQPAVWVPAGGQEKVILRIHPSAAEGVIGSYLSRIQVVSQSAPDKGKELEIQLKIVPEEKTKVAIQLRIESEELKAVPGSEVKIPVAINNLSQEAESLELSVQGVPASWVSLPSAVVSLLGGEGKRVEIILQIPPTPEIRAGYVPLKIIALSQKNPTIKNDVEVKLRIAAFESSGRVGVMLSSVQFSTAPGSALTIPVTVLNRGLEGDTFRLGVEGIPVNWVSTSTPSVQLEPGENKELSLVIQPTQTSSSQAGRYKFFILVVSQKVPDQVVKVDCTLSVAAYTKFSAKFDRAKHRKCSSFHIFP